MGETEWHEGQKNRTHHFHEYPRAVDARSLNPAFKRSEWERIDRVKQRRRKITFNMPKLSNGEIDFSAAADDMDVDTDEVDEEGDLLDLYVCCQCQVSCVVSGIIPTVLPAKPAEEFTNEKSANPSPGKNSASSVVTAWETINMYVLQELALIYATHRDLYLGSSRINSGKEKADHCE
jgi:ubiquitin carboxyl-terminal hydrolase 25/28